MIEWQIDPPKKQMTWHEAMEYAESLGSGWRLPTMAELVDACDRYITGFDYKYYWSSNTYANSTINAWRVHFSDGYLGCYDKTGTCYVRCIKDNENK